MTLAVWLAAVLSAVTAVLALVAARIPEAARRPASLVVPALAAVVLAGATLALAASVGLGGAGAGVVLAIVQELARALLAPLLLRERGGQGSKDT